MKLIKRILLGWRITLPIGGRRVAIPVVLSGFFLCCCCPMTYIFSDVAVRQAGLAPTYTPRPTNTNSPTEPPRATATEPVDSPTSPARSVEIAITPVAAPPTAGQLAPTIAPESEFATPTLEALPTALPVWSTSVPAPTDTAIPAPTATPVPPGPVAVQNSNLRAGPGTSYPTVGTARAGQQLDIVAANATGDWYQLSNGNWIAAPLVSNAPTDLPIAANIPPPPAPTAPPVRSAPVVVVPTSSVPYAGASSCDCSADLYNCPDFIAWDAQACYLRCMELVGRDVHRLDRDKDGSACEWTY